MRTTSRFRCIGPLLSLILFSRVAVAQTTADSVVPAIERGDLASAQRLLEPLASSGDAWAYFNLGVVHSQRAQRLTGVRRTRAYLESYAHFRAAELLGDTAAAEDRKQAYAVVPRADRPSAAVRVSALLARHGQSALADAGVAEVATVRTGAEVPGTSTHRQSASTSSLRELGEQLQSPRRSFDERERIARELSGRPGGREALTEILAIGVFPIVASGESSGGGGFSYDLFAGKQQMNYGTAERLGLLLCEILARAPSPSVASTVLVQRAAADLDRYNPRSPLIASLEALADSWATGKNHVASVAPAATGCSDTDAPSTPCLLRRISAFTKDGSTVSQACVSKVSLISTMQMVPDLGGRSDEDDLQRAVYYCMEGNAFVAFESWHEQLRKDVPRQFARMEKAFRIARQLNLIVIR